MICTKIQKVIFINISIQNFNILVFEHLMESSNQISIKDYLKSKKNSHKIRGDERSNFTPKINKLSKKIDEQKQLNKDNKYRYNRLFKLSEQYKQQIENKRLNKIEQELEDTKAEFESAISYLVASRINTEDISVAIEKLKGHWSHFIDSLETNNLSEINQLNNTVVSEMNAIVGMYQRLAG